MNTHTLAYAAAFTALIVFFIFVRSSKVLYVADGNIIIRGIFKKVALDPSQLRSVSRTTNATSRIFRWTLVVVETKRCMHTVYTRRITDKKWDTFIEDLK